MIIAFVGTVDDESNLPISGNGKTASMTGFSYMDFMANRTIWSNYYTDFSEKVCGMQEMINIIGKIPHPNLILCISEMQLVLNSIGTTYNQILFIDSFASQLRKLDVDLYYDTQRFRNIHKRLRIHTDVIMMPLKTHMDNSVCKFNRCKKPHKIYVFQNKPEPKNLEPKIIFNASKIGQHYDTNEIIFDKIIIPKEIREG